MDGVLSYLLAALFVCLFAAMFAAVLYYLLKSKTGDEDNALKVFKGANRLEGIPFYVKRGRTIHETAYLETLVTCTIACTRITPNGNDKAKEKTPVFFDSKTVSLSSYVATQLKQLQGLLADARQERSPEDLGSHWNRALEVFEGLERYSGKRPQNDTAPLVGNTIRDESYVDYSKKHYLNARRALIGSTDISTKLAADGTLCESAAKINDTTIEKFLGVLPVSDAINSVFTPAAAEAIAPPTEGGEGKRLEEAQKGKQPEKQISYEFSLDVQSHYIRHILYEEYKTAPHATPIDLASTDAWYRREVMVSLKPDESDKKAADKVDDKEGDK